MSGENGSKAIGITLGKCTAAIEASLTAVSALEALDDEQLCDLFCYALNRGIKAETESTTPGIVGGKEQAWHRSALTLREIGSSALRLLDSRYPNQQPKPSEILMDQAQVVWGSDAYWQYTAWPSVHYTPTPATF